MVGLPVVLCLHDTTELDFSGQTIEGLGPLSYEAQRGMYLHPTYAVSTDPRRRESTSDELGVSFEKRSLTRVPCPTAERQKIYAGGY